tara:strand:+ start:1375 stop:1653 length:279 start_codon:yes stop_codon:yes gene_type:complete
MFEGNEISNIDRHRENIFKNKCVTIDEVLFFTFELAFKDRMSGLSEEEFLDRFGLTNNEYTYGKCLNWGIAVTLVAQYLYRESFKVNEESCN